MTTYIDLKRYKKHGFYFSKSTLYKWVRLGIVQPDGYVMKKGREVMIFDQYKLDRLSDNYHNNKNKKHSRTWTAEEKEIVGGYIKQLLKNIPREGNQSSSNNLPSKP